MVKRNRKKKWIALALACSMLQTSFAGSIPAEAAGMKETASVRETEAGVQEADAVKKNESPRLSGFHYVPRPQALPTAPDSRRN